jgi:hypothetical protein
MSEGTSRKLRAAGRIALAVLVFVCMLGGWMWLQWRSVPAYWGVVDAANDDVVQQAERFEQWSSSQLTQERDGDGDWRVQIDPKQVNQWLAARLPTWATNQGVELPEWLKHPMVAIEGQQVIAAAQVHNDQWDKIVSLVYRPMAGDDGVVSLELVGLRGGRMNLPLEVTLAQVLARSSDQHRTKIEQGIRRVRLSIKLGDGRVVEVRSMKIENGAAVLSCRTVRANNP